MSRSPVQDDPIPVQGQSARIHGVALAVCAVPLLLLAVPAARALPAPVEPPSVRAQAPLPVKVMAPAGAACLRDASHAVRALCMHQLATRPPYAAPAAGRPGRADHDEAS